MSHKYSVSDQANTTPTPNSKLGGYAGNTRSGGTKTHAGIDDPSIDPVSQDVVRFHGTSEGIVIQAGAAYTRSRTYLGKRVTVQVIDENGVWESKTMHHGKVYVKVGDKVKPGDPIAEGAGKGEQFQSPKAGDSHVHWQLKRNGIKVDPLTAQCQHSCVLGQ